MTRDLSPCWLLFLIGLFVLLRTFVVHKDIIIDWRKRRRRIARDKRFNSVSWQKSPDSSLSTKKKENSWRIVAGVISFGAIGRTIDKRKVEILSQQNVVKYEIIINK